MDRRRLIAFAVALASPGLMASGAAKKEEKKKSGGTSYIQFQALAATITRANGRRGVLTVEVGLDVPNAKLREKAELNLPRLRAAFVQTLQIYAAGMTPSMPPNPDVLGTTMQRDTDRILGQPGAKLLLGTMLIN
jgi:hypothetical protein